MTERFGATMGVEEDRPGDPLLLPKNKNKLSFRMNPPSGGGMRNLRRNVKMIEKS